MEAVVDASAGREADAPAGEPEPPAEVDVLEVREVLGVEAADLEEDAPVDQHRAAAGEEKVAAVAKLDILERPPEADLLAHPAVVDGSLAEVEPLAVPVEDD